MLATLEPEAKEYRELDGNALYLRVRPDGNKSWQLRYKKPDGKWSWLGLGGYGMGDHQLSGSQARQKAAVLREDAAKGGNPLATKRARKTAEAEASSQTFEALTREWYASKRLIWTAGTAVRMIGALELHVFPVLGTRIYREILPMEWMEFLRSMEQKGIIEQTSRVRGMCREIYDGTCQCICRHTTVLATHCGPSIRSLWVQINSFCKQPVTCVPAPAAWISRFSGLVQILAG